MILSRETKKKKTVSDCMNILLYFKPLPLDVAEVADPRWDNLHIDNNTRFLVYLSKYLYNF